MEDLCKWADMAMYQAKDDGRNSIRFFDQKSVKYAGQDAIALHLNLHAVYECGQHTIDQEHRKLFDLANVLIKKGFSRDDDPHSFELALEELLAHVVQHFKDEEAILALNQYADLDAHVRAHKALVTRALQIHSEVLDGGVTIGELVSFLADEVVAQHMLKVDRKFFPLFNEIKLS
jgi:hemerythrin-like metal-binding protein